jgi:hypothetical protein
MDDFSNAVSKALVMDDIDAAEDSPNTKILKEGSRH